MSQQNGTYPTKEQIQQASKKALERHEDIYVEDWGFTVPVCVLSAGENFQYQAAIAEFKQRLHDGISEGEVTLKADRVQTYLCFLAMKNPVSRKRIFDREAEVAALDTGGVQTVFEAAQRVNRFTREAEDSAGEDSGETSIGDSPTSSPENGA